MKIINNITTLLNRRRELRNNATPQEVLLWARLKNSQLGFKFRRQHSIGGYIADFYCPSKKLVVEIDGSQHVQEENIEYDLIRTKYLEGLNIEVIRFRNNEINTNIEGVIIKIISYLDHHPPTPSFTRRGCATIKSMKFSKKVLKNGLRVITIPMKDNPTATVLVLVEAGSEYETKKINGISHFLEHMCFKGTIQRPKAIDIVKELDALGSQYNAFTAQEYTGYYAKSDAKHFGKIFDIVSDIYLNSTFPETEMEREKGVIIEEINMYEDMPNKHVQDLFMQLLYGDTPAGWNVAGEKKNISKMKRGDFVKYKKAHYLPESTVLVVAGQITEKEVMKEVKKVFGSVPRGQKSPKLKTREKQNTPQALISFKKTDQTHFVLGARSYDLFNKKNPALSVLGGILGGGMSSRLFQKLREEMGVGYYVRAYNDAYTDHGFFQISAGVDNKRINEVIEAVLLECRKLKNEKVSKEELDKVKECLIGNMKLTLEGSDDIANFYGGQELLKRELKNAEEKAAEIRAITAGQIQNLANDIFRNNKLNLALIGPFKKKSDFLKILKF